MANFEEVIFLISLTIFLLLFLYKFYNILNEVFLKKKEEKESKDMGIAFIIYTVTILMYGFSFVAMLVAIDNILMVTLFNFQTPLFILSTLFMLIQLFFHLQNKTIDKVRGRYNPRTKANLK